jgi:hypothetical protein
MRPNWIRSVSPYSCRSRSACSCRSDTALQRSRSEQPRDARLDRGRCTVPARARAEAIGRLRGVLALALISDSDAWLPLLADAAEPRLQLFFSRSSSTGNARWRSRGRSSPGRRVSRVDWYWYGTTRWQQPQCPASRCRTISGAGEIGDVPLGDAGRFRRRLSPPRSPSPARPCCCCRERAPRRPCTWRYYSWPATGSGRHAPPWCPWHC